MNPSLCHAGSRIQKISSTLRKVIGDGVTGSVSELSRTFMSMRRTGVIHFSDKMAMTESCSYASKIYLVFNLVCSVK